MAKVLTTALTLMVALAVLGVQTAAGISLNGQEIAHQGNGGGAPACTTCHGKQFQGDAALKAPAVAGLQQAFILSRFAHFVGPDGALRCDATSGDRSRSARAGGSSRLPFEPPNRWRTDPSIENMRLTRSIRDVVWSSGSVWAG
jgi:hypothetical protein